MPLPVVFRPAHRRWLYALSAVLLLPALLIHLGLMPLIEDEGIRATVALEMEQRGEYFLPTINGEYYYKKPPGYNWFLVLSNRLTGWYNEWSIRLPTVFFLLLYAANVYYFTRRHFDRRTAFLNAFLLLTCGRILFWDSLLGLIDTCFSWVIFLNFMWVYHADERRRPVRFFAVSYLLISAAWMLKGLPAAVFQATTLVPYLLYRRDWKRLFSPAHFLGVAVFVALVGGYYGYYWSQNPSAALYNTLFNESAQRTAVNYGIGQTILHLFTFPFEMTYHFMPWSLLLLYLVQKNLIATLRAQPFVAFCAGMFLTNVAVYWLSVEVYPRYLLMLLPLLFTVLLYLHRHHEAGNTWQYRTVGPLLTVFALLCVILAFFPFFVESCWRRPYWLLKTLGLLVGLLPLAYLIWRVPRERLLLLVPFLLLVRIGFNWFVLPDRRENDWGHRVRQETLALGEAYRDRPLRLYRDSDLKPSNTFYLTGQLNRITPRDFGPPTPATYYIFDAVAYPEHPFAVVDSIKIRDVQRQLYVGYVGERPRG